jgi:hypothetical protein
LVKRALLVAVPVALFLAGPSAASRSSSAPWVVVGRQHGVLLASSTRGLVAVVRGQAGIGARVLVRGGRVVGVVGRSRSALIRGVVVRHASGLTFLSAAGHLLVVHGGRRLMSATDTSPTPGTIVQQSVSFDDQGNLDDQGEQTVGQSSQVQVQAQITAIGNGTVTVTVNGQQLVLPLPAGLTLPSTLVGTQVTLNVSFANGQATANEQGDDNEQGDQQNSQSSSTQAGEQDDSGNQNTTTTNGSSGGGDSGGGD